ncbi:uncharacterized protein DUF1127 [Pacificibacter maritimus]|uniref:Uncharacterized protein DUF1127 n=1 Tax=Pacificibacter maritimus TaxID=762213 RepID=A0A3N4UNL3_9RHOB|nr:DUF1127 domain-containing protein [Pacificibacter maritimus]RPE71608.1 uncharacterized protein DUF1127 [Pacificibacter maritimus]
MAYAASNTQFGQSSLTERFTKLFSRIYKSFVIATVQARYMQELTMLSDRELNDIGISRADIPAIARDAARS